MVNQYTTTVTPLPGCSTPAPKGDGLSPPNQRRLARHLLVATAPAQGRGGPPRAPRLAVDREVHELPRRDLVLDEPHGARPIRPLHGVLPDDPDGHRARP